MDDTRSARKRQAIMSAATAAFLHSGYLGTSMDEIAAAAGVSKQTVYKHFSDKEQLFSQLVLDTTARTVDNIVAAAGMALGDSGDLARDLGALARSFIAAIWQPEVLRLRRLVIAEAGRFPHLGEAYWKQGFEAGLDALAASLAALADRGLLRLDDPLVAAQHFAGMVLYIPMNRAMFTGSDEPLPQAEIDHLADAGVRAFLAAYGRPRPARRQHRSG
jgi:TetR/AcrR family transcriptional repressor of mexJK operon